MPTPLRVAVISDALSSEFYFPIWYRYYASQLGPENIFLITYPGYTQNFAGYRLGGIVELPYTYSDHVRAKAISSYAQFVLEFRDAVIRVDTDEFVVPDPARYSSLATFMAEVQYPYVTGIGLDVIQRIGEPELTLDRPILVDQRAFCYANSSLNKTCITRVECRWGSGFHGSTLHPHFEDCYLIHFKRADIELQMKWFAFMNPQVEETFKEYYSPNRQKILTYHSDISNRRVRTA